MPTSMIFESTVVFCPHRNSRSCRRSAQGISFGWAVMSISGGDLRGSPARAATGGGRHVRDLVTANIKSTCTAEFASVNWDSMNVSTVPVSMFALVSMTARTVHYPCWHCSVCIVTLASMSSHTDKYDRRHWDTGNHPVCLPVVHALSACACCPRTQRKPES